jgi:hypothetical protein
MSKWTSYGKNYRLDVHVYPADAILLADGFFFFFFFGSCCWLEKREKKFRFLIPKIPKLPELHGRSREKKVFSAYFP